MEHNFDEKQIYDRGKAFQLGFIAALVTTVCLFIITDGLEIKIDSYAAFLFALWIPVTVCSIALIAKDAYDGVNSTKGRLVLGIYGIAGVMIIILTTAKLCTGAERIAENGCITSSAGHLVSGLCMVATAAVYWAKQYANAKEYTDDEKPMG